MTASVPPLRESLTPQGKRMTHIHTHRQTLSKEESWGKGEEGEGALEEKGVYFSVCVCVSNTHLPSSHARSKRKSYALKCSVAQ